MENVAAVILAGGKGTRMQSDLPKVLHPIAGRPMILRTLDNFTKLAMSQIVIVVGHKAEEVQAAIQNEFDCSFALQAEPLGTANAVQTALSSLNSNIKTILVVNGDDSAFYSIETIQHFLSSHLNYQAKVSILTTMVGDENKLGRVIRDEKGQFDQILEASEYANSGFQSREINCGAYVFDVEWLRKNIDQVPVSPKGEYYITELMNIAKKHQDTLNIFQLADPTQWHGINTPEELAAAHDKFQN